MNCSTWKGPVPAGTSYDRPRILSLPIKNEVERTIGYR